MVRLFFFFVVAFFTERKKKEERKKERKKEKKKKKNNSVQLILLFWGLSNILNDKISVRFTTTVELAQLFIIALSGNGRNSLPVSIGRGSQAATILEIVPKIGASVCDGGWSHLAYKLLFGEQQKFRLGHGNSALPFLKSGDVTSKFLTKKK